MRSKITLLLFVASTVSAANVANLYRQRDWYRTVVSVSAMPTMEKMQVHIKSSAPKRPTPTDYEAMRTDFFQNEQSKSLGSNIKLNAREQKANDIIMKEKNKEYEKGLVSPHLFNPTQHIFSVLEEIKKSQLFKYIEMMPKGAVLHSHDTALCSTDFLIEITYRDNLWICEDKKSKEAISLLFSKKTPKRVSGCDWSLLCDVREKRGNDKVDKYLRERLTLYPTEKFEDNNAAWQTFMNIFILIDGLLTYAPVWADYYYNALEEFYCDGVQYLELRTVLPILYDLEGTKYTPLDTVRIYKETLDKFKLKYTNFIGSKIIYAPLRNVDENVIDDYIKTCVEIQQKYPDFVAGFDLVGQEELGRPLKDFIPKLLSIPDNINFYFHAGETNWYGSSVDENLIDAVLLGTKRIGHGFALVKHPLVLDMLKERDIAIEINPVSNQVLQLVSDYRNHPGAHFFADNYPVVVSSDDPSFWCAKPLSHDFYMAFLGIASAHADLRLLKKLAMNSLQYSALTDDKKVEAFEKWESEWNEFIERVVKGEKNAANKNRID